MKTTIDDEAERYLRRLSLEWVRPEQGECLTCFTARMLHLFGCDGTLRFALFFRDQRAPAAQGLEHALGDAGGYCDCEVLMNAVEPAGALSAEEEDDDGPLPVCLHVPPGTTQPCAQWVERSGGADDDIWSDDDGGIDDDDY